MFTAKGHTLTFLETFCAMNNEVASLVFCAEKLYASTDVGIALTVTVSVCPSIAVCPIQPPYAAAVGLLLWARRAWNINRLRHVRRVNAGSATLSAYVVAEHRLVWLFQVQHVGMHRSQYHYIIGSLVSTLDQFFSMHWELESTRKAHTEIGILSLSLDSRIRRPKFVAFIKEIHFYHQLNCNICYT